MASEQFPEEHPSFSKQLWQLLCRPNFRSGGRFMQGEPGVAGARSSRPRHPYPVYRHKAEAAGMSSSSAVGRPFAWQQGA